MVYKPYFKDQGGPTPLKAESSRTVRLDEVDALGIVWHGRYASYLEDGREAIGRLYGLSYLEFHAAEVLLPIKTIHIDYMRPLKYLDKFTVETSLHWHEAARINMSYEVYGPDGHLSTRGWSVQLMVDLNGELLLEAPHFYRDFQKNWLDGMLEK